MAKIKIVSNYFGAWSKVILSQSKKKKDPRIAYLDLYAGPGRYKDGSASTPLWILGKAVKDRDLQQFLVTQFNDVEPQNVSTLKAEIESFPGIEQLTHTPLVTNFEVGPGVANALQNMQLIPTLFFVDPWGYKGLSIDLLGSAIRSWGCDCIFFFNYNRVNPGIGNPRVEELIDELFGRERANILREKVHGLSGNDRETMILTEIAEAIRDAGGEWVLPFTFRNSRGTRTSHQLIFVSKHFRGFDIMKDVMAKVGQIESRQDVRFEFNPAPRLQLGFLDDFHNEMRIDQLEGWLLSHFLGREVLVKELYEELEMAKAGTVFRKANYKEAIRRLENKSLVFLDQDPEKRPKRDGIVTVGDGRTVYFPGNR